MAKKKRVRLSKNQKTTLKHLKWFVENKIIWVGEQDFKDAVLDGHWAVFSIRENPYETYAKYWTFDCFDSLLITDSKSNAEAIVRWNAPTHALIVDLKYFDEISETRRAWKPNFNFPEDLDE